MLLAAPPPPSIPQVPFYSQFVDITLPQWQKVGCGVASLAMLIDYYKPGSVSVNTLLGQGTSTGAYLASAGWTYAGLIRLAKKYGLEGSSHDLAPLSKKAALAQFTHALEGGPLIASVHYKFDPKNPIPHLVVIDGIDQGAVYYNDPAAKRGEKRVALATFLAAWKKRYIAIRPPAAVALRTP